MKSASRLVLAAIGLGLFGTAWAQFVPGASDARTSANPNVDPVIQGNWQTITHPSPPPKTETDTAPTPHRGRARRQISTDSGGGPQN